MKEFMLQWQEGQEYLITAKKLRFRYEHGIMNGKHRKTVDRELTVRQFEIIRHNPDNGYYSFFYNGERQVNISIDTASDPNLVMIKCRDRFPGYAEGHTVYQSLPYDAKAKPIERFFVKLDNGKAFERREYGGCKNEPAIVPQHILPSEMNIIDLKLQSVCKKIWISVFDELFPGGLPVHRDQLESDIIFEIKLKANSNAVDVFLNDEIQG